MSARKAPTKFAGCTSAEVHSSMSADASNQRKPQASNSTHVCQDKHTATRTRVFSTILLDLRTLPILESDVGVASDVNE